MFCRGFYISALFWGFHFSTKYFPHTITGLNNIQIIHLYIYVFLFFNVMLSVILLPEFTLCVGLHMRRISIINTCFDLK